MWPGSYTMQEEACPKEVLVLFQHAWQLFGDVGACIVRSIGRNIADLFILFIEMVFNYNFLLAIFFYVLQVS